MGPLPATWKRLPVLLALLLALKAARGVGRWAVNPAGVPGLCCLATRRAMGSLGAFGWLEPRRPLARRWHSGGWALQARRPPLPAREVAGCRQIPVLILQGGLRGLTPQAVFVCSYSGPQAGRCRTSAPRPEAAALGHQHPRPRWRPASPCGTRGGWASEPEAARLLCFVPPRSRRLPASSL